MSGPWGGHPVWALPAYTMGGPSVPMAYGADFYNNSFVGASCGNYTSEMEAPISQPLSEPFGGDLLHGKGVKGVYRSNGEWVPVESEAAAHDHVQPNEDQQQVIAMGCDDTRMEVSEASTHVGGGDSDGCLSAMSAAETPVASVVTTPDKGDAKSSRRGHGQHGEVSAAQTDSKLS
jgi:hypothetical protein